jgi:hypothetical protein
VPVLAGPRFDGRHDGAVTFEHLEPEQFTVGHFMDRTPMFGGTAAGSPGALASWIAEHHDVLSGRPAWNRRTTGSTVRFVLASALETLTFRAHEEGEPEDGRVASVRAWLALTG